ncbi:nucleoporin FG repeat-containing protein [Aspergillus undulatus]|uniref:nucleoporin FG repeat-containing protein n=1 Tax=Aspergillus undulatus TaxID=1810928 RepID=UPI003CCD6266
MPLDPSKSVFGSPAPGVSPFGSAQPDIAPGTSVFGSPAPDSLSSSGKPLGQLGTSAFSKRPHDGKEQLNFGRPPPKYAKFTSSADEKLYHATMTFIEEADEETALKAADYYYHTRDWDCIVDMLYEFFRAALKRNYTAVICWLVKAVHDLGFVFELLLIVSRGRKDVEIFKLLIQAERSLNPKNDREDVARILSQCLYHVSLSDTDELRTTSLILERIEETLLPHQLTSVIEYTASALRYSFEEGHLKSAQRLLRVSYCAEVLKQFSGEPELRRELEQLQAE